MGKIGKISTIKREYTSSQETMESNLSKKGMTRIPGTGVFKYPYKEFDGKYRTGLDPDAAYIKRIEDKTERELEQERVKRTKKELEEALSLDLGPRSNFWNHVFSKSPNDSTHVQPVKLLDSDNLFDMSVPWKLLEFSWLRVHPTIASSYQAWLRGEFPAETQFYVVDEEIENKLAFNKKQLINNAIVKFVQMEPSKRRKVARLLGLPVTEDVQDEIVYNLVDNVLKQSEVKDGTYQGMNPVQVFSKFADMKDNLLNIKDLIKQALQYNIYRLKPNGKVYEGELEVSPDEEQLVKYLIDDDHQDELLALEEKLKRKKLLIA